MPQPFAIHGGCLQNPHVFLFDGQWSVKKSIVNVQIMGGYDSSICCDDMALMITIPDALCMVYLPTKLGDCWGFYVGKYSSTMEHIGHDLIWWIGSREVFFTGDTIDLPPCRLSLCFNRESHASCDGTVHRPRYAEVCCKTFQQCQQCSKTSTTY